jgi:hypothetical protein
MGSNRNDFDETRRRLKQRLRDAQAGKSNFAGRVNKAVSVNIGRPGGKEFTRTKQYVRIQQDESGTHEEVRTEEVTKE